MQYRGRAPYCPYWTAFGPAGSIGVRARVDTPGGRRPQSGPFFLSQCAAAVIPRWFLATLVFALPVLAIVLIAMLAAAAVVRQMGDVAGSRGLTLVAIVAGLLLAIDVLALLTVLGIKALDERP